MTKTTKLNGTDLGLPGMSGQTPSKKQICQMTCDKVTNKALCLKTCEGSPFDPNKPFDPKNFEKKIKEMENQIKNQIESQIEKDMCQKYSNEEECLNDCGIQLPGSPKIASMCENVCDKMNTLCKPSGPSGSVIVYPDTSSTGLSVGSIVVIVSLSLLLLILIFMVMTGRIKL